jgi:hypothetical protein
MASTTDQNLVPVHPIELQMTTLFFEAEEIHPFMHAAHN